MTNMADMPIYGKALKNSSPETKGQRLVALVCGIVNVSFTKYVLLVRPYYRNGHIV